MRNASTLEVAFWMVLIAALLIRIIGTLLVAYTPLGKLVGYSKENDIPANIKCRKCSDYIYVPNLEDGDISYCDRCKSENF